MLSAPLKRKDSMSSGTKGRDRLPPSGSSLLYRTLLVLLLTTFLPAHLGAQGHSDGSLLDPQLRDLFHEALSGEQAKEYVIAITRHHRIQGSRGYRDAAEWVVETLRSGGFSESDAFTESFASDGRVVYQTWQSPSGWDVDRAELRMVEPWDERIVGYPEIAMSLMTYSNPGHVRADLVWVGRGTRDSDYEGKDVAGKLVLCTGYGGDVHRLAVLKYGAEAVACYLDDERAREYPDMLQYTGIWPRTEELDRVTFGFNLTHRQGERLRALLESGERVVLDARVEGTGLEPFYMDVPVAVIRGSERSEEELVFSGHLDHPKESANDNASGSAAMLDMAMTLKGLIDSGRLPPPKRTLRFLWVPEFYGMVAYVDGHPELVGPSLGGKVLANINMDMVGESLELIHTKMILTRTPASVPSVLNDVVENMAAMVDRMAIRSPRGSLSEFNYRVTPYSGGSDHNVFIDRKIPAMMLGHSPDYTHHTSEDTPDKVDPVELERSEVLATSAFWYLSNLEDAEAVELAYLAGAKAAERLGSAAAEGMRHLLAAPDADIVERAWAEVENRIQHHLVWGEEAVRSVLHFNDAGETQAAVEAMEDLLAEQAGSLSRGVSQAARGRGVSSTVAPPVSRSDDPRVPARLTRGPLGGGLPASGLSGDRAAWYSSPRFLLSGAHMFELVNFIDGRRTITEIRDALSAEFAPLPTEVVARYVEDLVTVGVVEWQ
jgi:hypothetical protein